MAEGTPAPDLMQQMLNGQIGGGSHTSSGGAGSGVLALDVLGKLTFVDLVDTPGLLPEVSNGHLGLQAAALGTLDTKKSLFGLDLSDLFSRLTSEITDHTGGTGGDASGGGESGVAAPSDSGGGDDFQARVHSGNFDIASVEINDGGFVGKPSDVPDVRGGGAGGGIDFS